MISKQRIAAGQAMLAVTTVGTGGPVLFLHADVCDGRMRQHQAEGDAAGCWSA